ncbi:MAG: hypothetical protein R2719_03885 [Micropruina sp.]
MGKSDIAADLLARSFASGESMVNTKGVSRHLAEMAGRSRAELFWGSKRAAQDFVAVTECALLWERRARQRVPVGDQGMSILLLERGHEVMASADPAAAALAALRASGFPD